LEKKAASMIMLTLLFGSMFLSAIMFVECETSGPDLDVFLTTAEKEILFSDDGRGHLSSGNSTVLNATVTNRGDDNASNVILQLLINGNASLTATTPKLEINRTFWSAYFWTPCENGDYNLTVYAQPMDVNITNNNVTRLVRVCQDQPPIVNFTYSPPPPPPGPIKDEVVTFNASTSEDPDWGNITTYRWTFNSTSVPAEADPVTNYTFRNHGIANVTLTLYDSEGKSNSTSANMTIYARPVAIFIVTGPCYEGKTLTFDASSSHDPDGSILNYTWDFDDTNVTTVSDPVITHSYNTSRQYSVRLNVTDNDYLNGTMTQVITIGSGVPKANFSITQPPSPPYYVNENLTFDASNSTADGGTIISYFWDWNDTTTNTTSSAIINHVFTEVGVYNVTLVVTDSDNKNSTPTIKGINVILPVYMKVEPKKIVSDPGEPSFSVNITIVNVEDLKSFEFKLSWPPEWWLPPYYLLDYETYIVGEFLGDQRYPNGTERWKRNFVSEFEGYLHVNFSFTSVVPKEERNGTGTLVAIKFSVRSPGNATLDLGESILLDSLGNNISHFVEDSYFSTRKPVAYFSEDTHTPDVNRPVTFDASKSYDPDSPTNGTSHGILYYTWDFGDGNVTKVGDDEPLTPIITYKYTQKGTYYVNLTVTDDDGEQWSYKDPTQKDVGAIHNIAIINVTQVPVDCYDATISMVNITVNLKNNGNVPETFEVIIVYDGTNVINITTVTLPQGEQTQIFYVWNVTSFPKGNYTVHANATLPDDINQTDNTANTWVYLGAECDISGDGKVSLIDLVIMGRAYDSKPGDPNWNAAADLYENGHVGLEDLVWLARNYDP